MTAFGIERDPAQDAKAMADAVMAAARPWSMGLEYQAERAIDGLLDGSRDAYGMGVLAWGMASILHERVGMAWAGGWQPVDLDRYVRRKLKDPERELLGDVMADHLAQHAESTVDPDWFDQLAEIGAHVWWQPHLHFPEARGGRRDWREVVAAGVRLIATIWRLPTIETLGPSPGEFRPRADGGERPDVEPRILERVRQLLAKAESTTYEAEAETFTAGAQSLMAKHSIDAALLVASGPDGTSDGPEARRLGIDNPYESQKVSLLAEVARANRCRTIWTKNLGHVTLVGHREDRAAVETLFTSLLVQATQSMTHHGKRTDASGRSRTAAFRRSFLTAYAVRIGERLEEATRSEVRSAADELDAAGSGQELVPLLERRRAAVDSAVDEMFPVLTAKRATTVSDAEGWHSGTAAADRASLAGAKAVEG